MTTNGGDIKFSFTGDSSDLNAQLDKASKHLAGLGTQGTKTAGKLSKDLSKASVDSKKRIHELSETAGDADSVLMGLAGAVDLVSPSMGSLVRVSGDLLAATESVFRAIKFSNPVFLGLAAAATALGAAYYFLTEDTDDQREATEKLKKQQIELNKAFASIGAASYDLDKQILVLNGTITDADAKQMQFAENLRAEAAPTQYELAKATSKVVDELATLQQRYEDLKIGGAERNKEEARLLALKDAAVKVQEKFNESLEETIAKGNTYTNSLNEQADATKDATTATTELDEATQEWLKNTDADFGETIADLMAQDALLFAEKMEREEKIQAAILKRAELEEEASARAAAAAQASQEKQLTMAGQFAGSYFDIVSNMNDRMSGDDEESAMRSFRINQAAALVQIAVNTALAVSKASSQTGVLAAAAIPGIVALGAAQAAVVASQAPPKFHSGGMIAPDERTITAQTGEGVLSRSGVSAAGGAEGVHALNSGKGGQTIIVQQVWKHKIFDEFITENLRRTGSPLASAIRKGALV